MSKLMFESTVLHILAISIFCNAILQPPSAVCLISCFLHMNIWSSLLNMLKCMSAISFLLQWELILSVLQATIDCMLATAIGIGNRRLFSADVSQLPAITDPDVEGPFKDLMAASWDEIPDGVIYDVKEALSKTTEDKAGQEALANVFRAAEAVEHFAGVLVSLKMELDDSIGLTGEKVGSMADYLDDALRAAYKRYVAYLDAFGPDEAYLRRKVEMELGTKMIHLKMRCSGLEPEWGKVTVLGTSGLSGSYVEQRAR